MGEMLPQGDDSLLKELVESWTKENIEMPYIRDDGRKICDLRRKMRIALAKANNISYEPKSCDLAQSCAGTCRVCDQETLYLQRELEKIEIKERVYPDFIGEVYDAKV